MSILDPLLKLFHKTNEKMRRGERMTTEERTDFTLPHSLMWLMDASLFIDKDLIDGYYDAIVRPLNNEGPRIITISDKNKDKISGKLGIEGEVSPNDLFSKLLSPLNFKVSAKAEVAGEGESEKSKEVSETLLPIKTPNRRLEQLALHYVVNETDRLFLEHETKTDVWHDPEVILESPRAMAFFSLPSQEEAQKHNLPETKLIPTAAEFENGEIVPIYKHLKFNRWVPPEYPQLGKEANTTEELKRKRKEYWSDFSEHFNPTDAMIAVEEAAKNRGRIRWIAFRLPLTDEGDSLHLHIHPDEQYDTGVFAYNFIKRGFKHGIRVVGMLKSGPDFNVLAMYEK